VKVTPSTSSAFSVFGAIAFSPIWLESASAVIIDSHRLRAISEAIHAAICSGVWFAIAGFSASMPAAPSQSPESAFPPSARPLRMSADGRAPSKAPPVSATPSRWRFATFSMRTMMFSGTSAIRRAPLRPMSPPADSVSADAPRSRM